MQHKYWIINCLILVISLQAVWASADVHQWHEGEIDHSAKLFQDTDDDASSDELANISSTQIDSDDHHCCHCLSCHLSFLPISHSISEILPDRLAAQNLSHLHTTPWLAIPHNPPIA